MKKIPDPLARVLGKKEEYISRGKLHVASRVDAAMENFDFELKVSVTSFTMTVTTGGELIQIKSEGNKLDSKKKNMLSKNEKRR